MAVIDKDTSKVEAEDVRDTSTIEENPYQRETNQFVMSHSKVILLSKRTKEQKLCRTQLLQSGNGRFTKQSLYDVLKYFGSWSSISSQGTFHVRYRNISVLFVSFWTFDTLHLQYPQQSD